MNTPPDPAIIPHVFTDTPELATTQLPPAPRPDLSTPPDPAAEAARQAAFDSEFAWNGKPLIGFSSSREALFFQHRLSMGAPALDPAIADYDAFFADAARILWLCSHTPADWSILRVDPAALQCAIDTWTDEHIATHQISAASLLGLRIYNASFKNQHQAAPLDRKPHGDDLGK